MIFKHLQLKNFKSHADTELDLDLGISLIVGENGAGKSSIFEAISFALFKNYTTNNITDLVRTNKNLDEKIEMSVKLTFLCEGNEYMVERGGILSPSKTKSKPNFKSISNLFKISNGREDIIASGNKEVDRQIEELLNMNSSTFLNAIYIRQGEISALIDDTPANRKKLITKLLRIEELETAYNNIPSIIEEYKTRKAVLESNIRPESELNFELKKAKEDHFNLDDQIKKSKEEFEGLKVELENIKEEKEKLDKEKSDFESLKLKHAHEEENLSALNKGKEELFTKLNEITRNETEMGILKPFCEKLPIYKEFKESFLALNKLKEDEENHKKTLSQIEEYKTVIKDEQENHEKYIALEGEIKVLNNKKIEMSSEIKNLNELESRKDTLTQEVSLNNQKLETFFNSSKSVLSQFDLEEEISPIKTNDDFNKLESIVEDLRTNLRTSIDNTSTEIDNLKKESISLKQEIKSLDEPLADIKKVENKCPVCQSEISEDKKNELINGYEATISGNTKRINEINGFLLKLNEDKSLNESKLKSLDSIKNDIYANKHIVDDLDKSNKTLETLDAKIKELQGKKEELESLDKMIESKNGEFIELEAHNKKYLEASTLLKSFPDETKVKDDLYAIYGKIKTEDEKLKTYISSDSELSLNITLEELDESIEKLSEKDKRYNILLGSVKDKKEYEDKYENKKKEIESKTQEIEEIKKQIESSSYDEEYYNHVNILLERLNNKFTYYSQDIAVKETNLANFETVIKNIEEIIQQNREYKEEYIAVTEYYNLLEDFRKLYSKDGIQRDLKSQSRPLIQKNTKDFFDKFSFKYSDLILDDDYNISIFGPEGEANIDMVSGGEKIAIALALRLGITQAMSKGNIETILLDEPTIHLDSFRRQELINVLRSMSIIPQMIIVTHDTELETAADTLISVEKEEGISKIENS
ncbi:DNA double-strand break repair protein Rad50 [Methanobrevibacter ruminantium M1]|uniref:DNA double-strand break repair Rad50 ATPase n=1 Tax=Methanobrevibacter ruminantium (strain ATCC 35063 / DSM 1093 / JCM 13430 / OCM 146 / M1) TaxID=634498 RepID=D3E346_METRM|nr:SMC family ATPase [Methanobrevibacter ruminantium]ADC46957.1 DNA double-strand break repair protein Rad50 [Methanobrevibacter ruminantium M1]